MATAAMAALKIVFIFDTPFCPMGFTITTRLRRLVVLNAYGERMIPAADAYFLFVNAKERKEPPRGLARPVPNFMPSPATLFSYATSNTVGTISMTTLG